MKSKAYFLPHILQDLVVVIANSMEERLRKERVSAAYFLKTMPLRFTIVTLVCLDTCEAIVS